MPNESPISPIEVLISLMITILTMAILMLSMGSFLDGLIDVISKIDIPLSIWGQDMMSRYIGYARWALAFPVFFIILTIVWGVKTIIKKHTYTTQQDSFYSDQF